MELINLKYEYFVDRTYAKLRNMNFADKFENVIPTRKKKGNIKRIMKILTEKFNKMKMAHRTNEYLYINNSMAVLKGIQLEIYKNN